MDTDGYDVVVIGGGVVGCAAALEAARGPAAPFESQGLRRAAKVLLVEQHKLGHSFGSSHGRSRIIRKTYPSDFYTSLMPHAYTSWADVAASAGVELAALLRTTGGIDLLPTTSPLVELLVAACERHSVDVERLDEPGAQARFGVKLPEGYCALFQRDSGVLDAAQCCNALVRAGRACGVEVLEGHRASGLFAVIDGIVKQLSRAARAGDDGAAASRAPDASLQACAACGRNLLLHLSGSAAAGSGGHRRERVVAADRVIVCPGPWATSCMRELLGMEQLPSISLQSVAVHFVPRLPGPQPAGAATASSAAATPTCGGPGGMPVLIDYADWSGASPAATSPSAAAAAGEPAGADATPVTGPTPLYMMESIAHPGMVKIACHVGYPVEGATALQDPTSRERAVPPHDFEKRIAPWLKARIPQLDCSAAIHSDTCLYTNTVDEDFIIDDVTALVGGGIAASAMEAGTVVLACGMSGHGFKLAPVSGRIAAAVALSGSAGLGAEARGLLAMAAPGLSDSGFGEPAAGPTFGLGRRLNE